METGRFSVGRSPKEVPPFAEGRAIGTAVRAQPETIGASPCEVQSVPSGASEIAVGTVEDRMKSIAPMPTLLIVEDNPDDREALAASLALLKFDVVTAKSAEEAQDVIEQSPDIRVVLCDICLPGMDGITFHAEVRKSHPSLKVILLSGYPDAIAVSIESGVIAVPKPYDLSTLAQVIVETYGDRRVGAA